MVLDGTALGTLLFNEGCIGRNGLCEYQTSQQTKRLLSETGVRYLTRFGIRDRSGSEFLMTEGFNFSLPLAVPAGRSAGGVFGLLALTSTPSFCAAATNSLPLSFTS